MTIHVTIKQAKEQLTELVAAALRGEDVVLDEAGLEPVRIVPVRSSPPVGLKDAERKHRAKKRKAGIGMWKKEFDGWDTSIEALKADRGDPEERFRRKFGPAA